MLISANYGNVQFGGLIPLKDYKGTILKLTEGDIIKIKQLQASINQLKCELYKLETYANRQKMNTEERDRYSAKWISLDFRIKRLEDEIKSIKMNRLNMQKEYSK